MALHLLTASEHLRNLESGAISSFELTCAYLDRIQTIDSSVRAFLRFDAERALERAAKIDMRRSRRQPVGRLAGLPVAVKDIFCEQGERTTCASKMLADFRAPYDATVISRLRAADAVLIGRTNMDEFAMGGSTENSAFQVTRNPWDLERTPGGSSGGSAAAVAAGMAPLAIGTDTGGSIRQPAGLCGIAGMKPTYGRVSRYGVVAYASSLDQVGPFGQSVEDLALLLEVLAGHDPRDSTSLDAPVPAYSKTVSEPLASLRIGWVREHFGPGLDVEVEAAVRGALEVYRSLGASLHEISLPHSKYAVATYYVIAPSEASSNLARYDGVHFGYRTNEQQMLAELDF
jgi:aspartyl-tRNA(Asn)/glutamyl-tRNA(Gln) amidotransferase subunit A